MKSRFFIAIIALTVFAACTLTPGKGSDERMVTVSILPQKTFVTAIAGDKFRVNVLIPEEGNHETYEPTSKQMIETGKSEAYFALGHLDFEQTWLRKLAQGYPDMKIINTSEGLDLITGEEIVHGDHVHHGGIDPHIWLSPSAVKIQAANILNGLIHLDAGNSAYYTENFNSFIRMADSVDSEIRQILGKSGAGGFMIYHPSLGYFARDYSLQQIAIEQEGKEPSPAYMKALIDTAGIRSINTIFVSSQFSTRSAHTLANQLNAKVVEFNPVDPDWAGSMINIARRIAEASNK